MEEGMAEEDRAMMAREVKKIGNKIEYRRQQIKMYQDQIPALEARRDELLKKIADDYDEEHGQ
jgi:uncharacterized coiled-coil DUF342 family protein